MFDILKIIERILGKSIDPALQQQLMQAQVDALKQHQAQMQQQSQHIFHAPRQAGRQSAIAQMAGCPPPGQVQYIPPQKPPFSGLKLEEYYRQMMGMAPPEPEPEPEDTVMEFSLED